MNRITEETRLKKAHIALMKHHETALYSGVMMMGKSEIIDENITAYTDGVNKKYGRSFVSKLKDEELRALVLHENLHVALKHVARFKREFKDDPQLVNMSADYVVNDVIVNIKEHGFLRLPDGGLVDDKYHNWSVREVYNDLKDMRQNRPQEFEQKYGDGDGNTMDEHDFEHGQAMSEKQSNELSDSIDKALREGSVLAGRLGAKIPRTIEDLLAPKVDWRTVLREFIMSVTRGTDEYSWRRFNKRHMVNDIYLPITENERVGELVVAIDTSGSIGTRELTEFTSELVSICEVANPEKIKLLWWDTEVHGIQEFADDYTDIQNQVKPQGGGGTDPQCIPKYINDNNINAQGLIVFTDGYFYGTDNLEWSISYPTLWLVTENEDLRVPTGKIVKYDRGNSH